MEATLDKSKSSLPFPVLSAEEAAAMVNHNQVIGFSGFTPAGAAKAVPRAIAAKARAEHEAGRPFQIGVLTGASTGASLDGELAKANAVSWRTPYQSDSDLRALINKGSTNFFDMHLSVVPQYVRYGFFGKVDWAIVEACDVTADGEIILTTSVGVSPTYCRYADKIIIELNSAHPAALRGIHDIYEPLDPPARREIPVYSVSDRIGSEAVKVDPKKIVGIVQTNIPDEARPFKDLDPTTKKIGENVAEFLAKEMHEGRIPKTFLPIQSGVGNVANAVLSALGEHPDIPPFDMYSEVVQDSVVDMMLEGKINFVSGTSLSVSNEKLQLIYENLDDFRKRMVLRPQEISNNPEVARRIGIISINTAIEVDIFGNINSTHIMGKSLMNGIGGSGDFTRSAYLSIFTCPSVAKGGKISAIVPQCSHIDHSEHSVQAVITEQGYANLRCKSPKLRAEAIIEHCAHPSYKDILQGYCHHAKEGYTPQTLALAYAMHQQFLKSGDMHDVDWAALVGAE
ncbi:MAG: acetyl-CoA hydrolase/transferase family protein [Verrucomicrobiota bacterium JB024]|nr:acetyl-CoA hydrolase/transferase family protein [Verrucomicrobiota bacterium JB024]